jgi:hypothetical protein
MSLTVELTKSIRETPLYILSALNLQSIDLKSLLFSPLATKGLYVYMVAVMNTTLSKAPSNFRINCLRSFVVLL